MIDILLPLAFILNPVQSQVLIAVIILFVAISLYMEFYSPAKTFFIAVIVLSIFGVLSADEILMGFANEQIATIMLLLVIGGILNRSSILDLGFKKLFSNVKSYSGFIFRMVTGVSFTSAFINNTPIVAILIPYVYKWGKTNNINSSKLMIPLSFAAILGGTATLVGTSTNLLVNGLAMEYGLESLGVFDFTIVGLPLIFIGLIYLLIFGNKMLPNKTDPLEDFTESPRKYIAEVRVNPNSELVGKTIMEANLRHLDDLFLAEIIREDELIAAVSSNDVLQARDILLFAGDVNTISDMIENVPGLSISKSVKEFSEHAELIEVIVTPGSKLVNNSVKQSSFRNRFDATVVAIHRDGEAINGKLGNVTLQSGDVLLLVTGNDFNKRNHRGNFTVLSKIKDLSKLDVKRSLLVLFGLLASIVMSVMGIMSLFNGLLILLGIITITRIVAFRELKDLIDTNLLVLAALALSLGTAIHKTGAADIVANFVVNSFEGFGVIGVLLAIYLITNILTEIMTNIAAASLSFPLAISAAMSMGVDPKPFVLVVAIAASASFITPIGYQTNLMVYGPGGYNFKDFFKIGLPLSILYMLTTIAILSYHYDLF